MRTPWSAKAMGTSLRTKTTASTKASIRVKNLLIMLSPCSISAENACCFDYTLRNSQSKGKARNRFRKKSRLQKQPG
jgi:hypothetical protein